MALVQNSSVSSMDYLGSLITSQKRGIDIVVALEVAAVLVSLATLLPSHRSVLLPLVLVFCGLLSLFI